MSSYNQKLKDPRWQRKRCEILQRDNFRCVKCGNDRDTLHVHHIRYYGDPWDAKNIFLQTLCETCHKKEHAPEPLDQSVKMRGKLTHADYTEVLNVEDKRFHPIRFHLNFFMQWENKTEEEFTAEYKNVHYNKADWTRYLEACFNNDCFKWNYIITRGSKVYGEFLQTEGR